MSAVPRDALGRARRRIAWLWAAGLAVLAAGTDLAARAILDRAGERTLLLLPAAQVTEAKRQALLSDLRVHPELRDCDWISPSRLAQETSSLLPRERWGEVFSEEDTWLPWVVEGRFRDPVWNRGAVANRVAALKGKGDWRLVLWDQAALDRDRGRLFRILILAGLGGAILFVLGASALRAIPREGTSGLAEAFGNAAGASIAASAIGGAATLLGLSVDPRAWGIALAACFILAALAAPMLKGPTMPQTQTPRAEEPKG